MTDNIRPRKIAGWKFFNDNPNVCDVVRQGGLHALKPGDQEVAKWFIEAVSGCKRVLDLGCGSGFPGLFAAYSVNQLVGVDAAPNMILAAKANAVKLGMKNASFEVGSADDLGFGDEQFDGAIVCGLLESMDWKCVHRSLSELWRVPVSGGRVAVLDQDWGEVMERKALTEANIIHTGKRLMLQYVARTTSPHTETDTRFLVDPESHAGKRLLADLKGERRVRTTTKLDELKPSEVLDCWYDESAQFDARTLRELMESKGFRNIKVNSRPVWDQRALFLLATK
jgi:ubiquinone/menaquinone biosynthesis C-methylase UbiE